MIMHISCTRKSIDVKLWMRRGIRIGCSQSCEKKMQEKMIKPCTNRFHARKWNTISQTQHCRQIYNWMEYYCIYQAISFRTGYGTPKSRLSCPTKCITSEVRLGPLAALTYARRVNQCMGGLSFGYGTISFGYGTIRGSQNIAVWLLLNNSLLT